MHVIGYPEARIILAQCATYLASSPKSNASYLAIGAAQEKVQQTGDLPVPLHIRNAPTRLMKKLNYGAEYKYPHNYPVGIPVLQNCPDNYEGICIQHRS